MKNIKKIAFICVPAAIILLLTVLYINTQYLLIPKKFEVHDKIGVIDEGLSFKHSNIKKNNVQNYTDSGETHGDLMVKFLKDINVDNIYYFDARTENDKITADSIISGLEWMKSNDVKYVNISLSSKKKSEELSNWISDNKDTISVYASYNNLTQSFDYPAMYDDVIGSGINNELMNSEKDRLYKSNKIVLDFNFRNCYYGNSYLSLYTLISDLNIK